MYKGKNQINIDCKFPNVVKKSFSFNKKPVKEIHSKLIKYKYVKKTLANRSLFSYTSIHIYLFFLR